MHNWRIRAAKILTATGAIERPLSFAGNDLPGVILASALRDYVENFGVSMGDLFFVQAEDGIRDLCW